MTPIHDGQDGAEWRIGFGTLGPEGFEPGPTIRQSSILACPYSIIDPKHYRDDETCKCDDPVERLRLGREYGYKAVDFAGVPLRHGPVSWWQVYDVTDGATGAYVGVYGPDEAERCASGCAERLRAMDDELGALEQWAVYILPHYCAPESASCECNERENYDPVYTGGEA